MTTQRQKRVAADKPALRGPHVLVDITTATDHTTTLTNAVFRGQFKRADGTPVVLAAGPRAALLSLLSYRRELQNPAYRLKMDDFVGDFKEGRDAVYRWIRGLEAEGFVHRWRANDPDTGQFEWYIAVSDSPRAYTPAAGKPQVTPSLQNGGDGAAPPVDNSETRRSDHPHKSPGWQNPSMVKPEHGDSYRETLKEELPASPPVPATRATAEEAEVDSRGDQPTLSLVRPTAPTPAEANLAPEPGWVDWVNGLLDHRAVRAANPLRPTRRDLEMIAIRAQVAVDHGWNRDQLAERVLLVELATVQHLGSVWSARLHPETLSRPPTSGKKTNVELGQRVPDAMVPDADRRAEIRQLHGVGRGMTWEQRMGGVR